ncbi:MAG: ParA family protein [Pseudomonadota bacterium]
MDAKLIAVFNQKGGCAKTMTTMQLGGALGLRGIRTLVVDMDRQGTSSLWSAQADSESPFPATVISLAPMKEKMIGEILKLKNEYDVILIDCPPAIESSIPWSALLSADIALIPVIPVMDNVWASKEAKELAKNAKRQNPDLQTFYVASMMRRGNLFKACMDLLENDEDVEMLKSSLSLRNAFPESQLYGGTVHLFSKNSPATEEVEALADEVLEKLGMEVA